jgi:hypothetical protein
MNEEFAMSRLTMMRISCLARRNNWKAPSRSFLRQVNQTTPFQRPLRSGNR